MSGTSGLSLNGISCPTSNFCLTAGSNLATVPDLDVPYGVTWNGSTWQNVTNFAPVPGGGNSDFRAVSCLSPTFCMAVGRRNATNLKASTMAEVWNGSTWTLVPTASPGILFTEFQSVSCGTTTWCVATGYEDTASGVIAIAELWTGSSFTQITPPSGGLGAYSYFHAVDCVAKWCLIAGDTGPGPDSSTALAFVYDNGTWSTSPVLPHSNYQFLHGVSCASTVACMVVGSSEDLSGTAFALAERWNGTAWTVQTVPVSNATYGDNFHGVTCVGPTSCVAVGLTTTDNSGDEANLIDVWNGTTWTTQSSNPVPGPDNMLNGVSCVPNLTCRAAGINDSAGGGQVLVAPIHRSGYYEVASDGGMFNFGAPFFGSIGGHPLNAPVVAMAVTPDGGGYWEVATDGGIFSFGDAKFYGSMGGKPLNKPIVGIVPTLHGRGYWEVAADGGLFSFGDAPFYGSMGGKPLNKPIVGMALAATGLGYYEVATDGGLFSFGIPGQAPFYGSTGNIALTKPIVGMAVTSAGGYYEVASDGGLFAFGGTSRAPFKGSMGGKPLNSPIVGMAVDAAGGYYEVASDGGIFNFGGAPFKGSMGGKPLVEPIVGIAT
jgi:hypothetical protein